EMQAVETILSYNSYGLQYTNFMPIKINLNPLFSPVAGLFFAKPPTLPETRMVQFLPTLPPPRLFFSISGSINVRHGCPALFSTRLPKTCGRRTPFDTTGRRSRPRIRPGRSFLRFGCPR